VRRALVIAALALAGCGNTAGRPPESVVPATPQGDRFVILKAAGVRFKAPFNWPELAAQGSRAGGIQSRTATVAVWRYPRAEPLPHGKAALEEVRGLLIDRVKKRDPGFELRKSDIRRRAGADAIELVGRQTIAGLPYDVRSSHVFKDGAEVVVDAYARPQDFARVDAAVFEPLLASLKLTKPKS
jgi:hypothetical protein